MKIAFDSDDERECFINVLLLAQTALINMPQSSRQVYIAEQSMMNRLADVYQKEEH